MNIIKMNYQDIRELVIKSIDIVNENKDAENVFLKFRKNKRWFKKMNKATNGFDCIKDLQKNRETLPESDKIALFRFAWLNMTRDFINSEEYSKKAEDSLKSFLSEALNLGLIEK